MRRSSLLFAALACLAPAATAQAQAIGVNVIDFSGRSAGNFDLMDLATVAAVPITEAECTAGAEVTFRFTNIDINRTNLYFYQGASCDDVMIRNNTVDDRCSELAGPFSTEMRPQRDITLTVDELVPCGEGGSGVITIWVLAVNNTMSDEVGGAGQQVSFPIAYDFEGPGAPANFTAVGGEDSITLDWEGGTDQVREYEVYVDPTGCSGGAPSGPLVDDPENPPLSLRVRTVDGPTNSAEVPFPASVPIPGEAAVAIRAIDRTGNPGDLSTVRCVRRFEVTSWFEMYCMDGAADACSDAGCSVSSRSRSGSFGLGLFTLALGAVLLRRRSRR